MKSLVGLTDERLMELYESSQNLRAGLYTLMLLPICALEERNIVRDAYDLLLDTGASIRAEMLARGFLRSTEEGDYVIKAGVSA